MISAVMISSHVFAFLNIQTTMLGRNLHMLSTSWGFVLMAIHLGLHLNVILFKVNKKMKDSTFEYVYYLIMILFIAFGIYAFIDTELWKDMFLVNQFKFFDYEEAPFIFYLKEFLIVCFLSLTVYFVLKIKKGAKKS